MTTRRALAVAWFALASPVAAQVGGTATVIGVVYDSLARTPFVKADVQVVAQVPTGDPVRPFFTTTDERGAFRIDSVPAGTYLVGFFHPRLDSLGFTINPSRLVVSSGERVKVALGTPGPGRLIS